MTFDSVRRRVAAAVSKIQSFHRPGRLPGAGPLVPHQLLAIASAPEALPFSETRVGGAACWGVPSPPVSGAPPPGAVTSLLHFRPWPAPAGSSPLLKLKRTWSLRLAVGLSLTKSSRIS